MRSSRTFALVVAITLGFTDTLLRPLHGAPLQLIQFSSPWRYYAGAVGLPSNWAQTNFDDATWPLGPGALGVPLDENLLGLARMQTLLPLTGSNGAPIIGYYFRTQFTFPTNTLGVTLLTSNLIDDGAVIYLNGAEATRIRMPAGVVTTNTLGSLVEISTAGPWVTNLVVTNLVEGENLLAVEVHQSSTTSVDAVFAMSLTAMIPEALAITEQPASQTVPVGSTVSLSVGVAGTSPSFRWFRNGTPIFGTNSTFTFRPMQTNESADYFVVATNTLGSVTSEVAQVTVVADVYPPTLVSALEGLSLSNSVIVTFSELVHPATATNPANYRITQDGAGTALVVSNAASLANQVRLRVSPWQPGAHYILTVNNVQDFYTNTIAPDSRIAVGFGQEAISMDANWRFHAMGWEPGTNWLRPDYDDQSWPEARAPFYFDQDDLPACAGPKATALTYGYNTYYFRTRFPLSETTGRGVLSLTAVVDDGAVFYLNGQEIRRRNLPSGPVSYSTWALLPMTAACLPFDSTTVTNLVSGDNVLAVEVHQAQDPGFDVVFGAALTLVHQPELPAGAVLFHAREGDGRLRLWWTGGGAVLQRGAGVEGSYEDLAGEPPVVVSPGGLQHYYRLRRAGGGN